MIRPLGNNVTAKLVEAQQVTASGIFLPGAAAESLAPKVAEVLAIGAGVTSVKVGEKVVFKPYATYEIKDGEAELVMLEEADILGVVEG